MRAVIGAMVVGILAAGVGASAQAPPPPESALLPRELSLTEALALADASSPLLAAARQRASAAVERARATDRGVAWPRVVLSNAWTLTDTPASVFAQKLNAGSFTAADFAIDSLNSPSARGHLSSALALDYPLDVFRKASPQTEAARATADVAGETARETELELRRRVIEAWHRCVVATRAVLVTERAAAGALSRERQIEELTREGAALHADLLRARSRRRSLEADLAARRGEDRSAAAGLALAIGSTEPVTPTADAASEPSMVASIEAAPQPLSMWLERAVDRPAVAAARAAVVAAEQISVVAGRSLRPDLALSAQLQDDRGPLSDGQTTGVAGIYLRFGLFDPQRAADRAQAELTVAAAAADLEAALAQVRFEIESAWHRDAAARERWQAARGGTGEGHEALRVVRERRAAGLATLTDELETEAAALAAELAELSAATDAAISRAALERAAGVGFLRAEANP